MIKWLRKLDDVLFSPPHTFSTVLAFVAIRLTLDFQSGADEVNTIESSAAEALRRPE